MDDDKKEDGKQSPGKAVPDSFGQARHKLDDIKSRIPNTDNIPKEQAELINKIHFLSVGHAMTRSDLNIAQGEGNIAKLKEIKDTRIPELEKQLNEITESQLLGLGTKINLPLGEQFNINGPMAIYKDPAQDPHIRLVEKDIVRKTYQDPQVQKAANLGPAHYKSAWNKASLKIKAWEWNNFIEAYPDKATTYRKFYSPIANAFELHDKLSEKWKSQSGKTKEISLDQDPIYRSFIDNPDTGVAATIWKEFPDEKSILYAEFSKKAEKIRADLDRQFAFKHPEIAVKYRLLAEKQANMNQEERERKKDEENSLKDFIKRELERQEKNQERQLESRGQQVKSQFEEQSRLGQEQELVRSEDEIIEKMREAPQQEVVEEVEVKETSQPARPSARQAQYSQPRMGNIDRLNRMAGRVRRVGSTARKARSIASLGRTLRTGTTGARIAGAAKGVGALLGGGSAGIIIAAIIIILILLIILIIFIVTALQAQQTKPGTPVPTISITPSVAPPRGNCPDQATIDANKSATTCKYLNTSGIGLFDATTPPNLNAYINTYSGIFVGQQVYTPTGFITGTMSEFLRRVNYIVQQSVARGISPALPLGYWWSESNFSTGGRYDLGCAISQPPVTFDEQVDCFLAQNAYSSPTNDPITNCAISKDANSLACQSLKSSRSQPLQPPNPYAGQSFDQLMPITYPLATLNDFAEAYGPYYDMPIGANCASTYNKLIEVAELTGMCKSGPVPGSFIYYCQGDPRWQPPLYTCDPAQTVSYMGSAGCGPASLAIIMASKGAVNSSGQPINPVDTDTAFQVYGWRACDDRGTLSTNFLTSPWFMSFGFSTAPFSVVPQFGTFDINLASQVINQGYWILGSSPDFPCANLAPGNTTCSHIFAIDSVDPATGTIHVQDPNNCQYGVTGASQGPRQSLAANGAFTWLWAYPVKK